MYCCPLLAQGSDLLRRGEPSPCIYVVLSGECTLRGSRVGLTETHAGLPMHEVDLRVLKVWGLEGGTGVHRGIWRGGGWPAPVALAETLATAAPVSRVIIRMYPRHALRPHPNTGGRVYWGAVPARRPAALVQRHGPQRRRARGLPRSGSTARLPVGAGGQHRGDDALGCGGRPTAVQPGGTTAGEGEGAGAC